MTPRQSFALFTLTGVDCRPIMSAVSVEAAGTYIELAKNEGRPEAAREALIYRGGIAKRPLKVAHNWEIVYDGAWRAGEDAARKHTPTPMVVTQHANPLDDNSPPVKEWYVHQGVCGFAWVTFPGNTSFGRWAVKQGHARKAYGGGVQVWIGQYGQSAELKEAHANAMAKYLRENGVERAYAGSRLD